ncbi:MAG: response regulator [Thermoanaerobaculia bacterium]|nr:response regulator [Thermoanaerobaculia bacterium]
MNEHDPEILLGFLEEVRAYLPELRRILERAPGNGGPEEGYRMLHCVRGAASMLGFGELADQAHAAERRFHGWAQGTVSPDDTTLDELTVQVTDLEHHLTALAANLPVAAPEAGGESVSPAGTSPAAAPIERAVVFTPAEDVPADILAGFYQEAEEHLEALGLALTRLAVDPGDLGAVSELRRRVHTLKGAAAMAGFPHVAEASHRLEDDLERFVAGARPLSAEDAAGLEGAVDHLARLLAEPPNAGGIESRATPELTGAPSEPAEAVRRPERGRGDLLRVSLDRLDRLVRVASELLIQSSVFERGQRELAGQLGEMGLSVRRLRGLSDRLEADFEAAALAGGGSGWRRGGPAPGPQASGLAGEFDELELDRYTEFHLLSRGLAETVDDIGTVGNELGNASASFDNIAARQARLLRELQEGLLELRAVPVGGLGARLARSARVTARERGKDAALRLVGGDVELDKGLLDELGEVLLHLVRNAVDHGIETPAVRRSRGKPERGEIVVTVRSQAGQVVVEVADDGAGIDELTVREAAVTRGLVGPEVAAELPRAALFDLLFESGFSTAREISEVSGRGVGLDVVRDAAERLRGAVALDSEPGVGTRVTLRLPLSLAITRALLFEARGRTFALPMSTLRRVVRLEPEAVTRTGAGRTYRLDGEELPLRVLGDVFALPAPAEGEAERPPLLIVETVVEGAVALAVDRYREAREVVVKPLGPLLRRVEGVAGATLLGDGTVVPILDPNGLRPLATAAVVASPEVSARARRRTLEVLIVDDSLSARRVLANLVRGAGWTPLTARDGVEALELLQQLRRVPDLLLLDIEMPRMDGYELTATLRGQAEYAEVPIVIITSRAGAKHREKAYDLGVSGYLVKPFAPEELIRLAQELTAEVPVAP